MTYRIRAFEISLVIHILFITVIVSAGALLDTPCSPLVISFDIARGDVKGENFSAPPSMSVKKQPQIKRSEPLTTSDKEKILQEKPAVTSQVSEASNPKPAPPATSRNVAALSRQETSENKGQVGHSTVGAHESERSARESYLREHFLYIKDRILDSIAYPNHARRMGWHGKVLTSFVIHVDGTVSDIKIISSSGFKVLDENAVMTIKEVSPFPKPPCTAKIIIPIAYRLNPG